MPAMPSIDVVIPVYNAPELTRRCIDSVVTCLSSSIKHIYVQDDASGDETRRMLDQLPYRAVHVHHAEENQGFGTSVNEAINRSDASYVLVLNSDTEVSENFLPKLNAALEADPQLAVLIPAGNEYTKHDLDQYVRRSGGYIQTHRLRGHAFLIRRTVFQEAGGFDPAYGRGYYEDVDLGRRLDLQGWRLGVHPEAHIQHKGGGSFGRGRSFRELARRNRNLYFSRYSRVGHNILLLSGNCLPTRFPSNLLAALERVFQEGALVHWLTPEPARLLLCLQMHNYSTGLSAGMWVLFRSWRKDKRISEIWLLPGVSRWLRASLIFCARILRLKVFSWERAETTPNGAPKQL
jgi:GT2 family glycosyltransferase